MNFTDPIQNSIESNLSFDVTTTVDTTSFEESTPAFDFVDAGVIDASETQTKWYIIKVKTQTETLIEINIAHISTNPIFYISDFEVHSEYQNQGLGSTAHRTVVDAITTTYPTAQIFELPTTEPMRHIVSKKDNFVKCSQPALSGWYQYQE